MENKKKHVFIIGSKGIPAQYGGFESFVENLTKYRKDKEIQYYVSCIPTKEVYDTKPRTFKYNHANCFYVTSRNIGPAKAVVYHIEALRYCIRYISKKG